MPFQPALFVLLLAPEFFLPLRLLGAKYHAGMTGSAAMQRIVEILETPVPQPGSVPYSSVQRPMSQEMPLTCIRCFKLSGGERQRLAIARAFLKRAPLLLLDEPTANLDALTERSLLHAIRSLIQGHTTIMITHRLAGLDMADEILVLQAGKIKERGKHHDLLQAEGLYWKLWQLQNQVIDSSRLT